jgi:type III secretory pathway component EscV
LARQAAAKTQSYNAYQPGQLKSKNQLLRDGIEISGKMGQIMESKFPSLTLFTGQMPGIDLAELEKGLPAIQETLYYELGLITPLIHLENDKELPEQNFCVMIDDRRLERRTGLSAGEFWAAMTQEVYREGLQQLPPDQNQGAELLLAEMILRDSTDPNTGVPAIVLRPSVVLEGIFVEANFDIVEYFRLNGITVRDQLGYVIFCVAADLRKHTDELLSTELARYYLKKIEPSFPDLVAAAEQEIGIEQIRQELQAQVKKGQSIFNFPTVLDQILTGKFN